MVNEDILTALRNSINNGESLEYAKQILIYSGYNLQEVQEASNFIGSGISTSLKTKPDEHLVMPQKKSFFQRFKVPQDKQQIEKPLEKPAEQIQPPNQLQPDQPSTQLEPQQIETKEQLELERQRRKDQFLEAESLSVKEITHQETKTASPEDQTTHEPIEVQSEKEKTKTTKKSHKSEITLLVILIILVGVLIATFLLKNQILTLLSG